MHAKFVLSLFFVFFMWVFYTDIRDTDSNIHKLLIYLVVFSLLSWGIFS